MNVIVNGEPMTLGSRSRSCETRDDGADSAEPDGAEPDSAEPHRAGIRGAETSASRVTLLDLLDRYGRDPRTVAIEHNGAIIKRDRYAETRLRDGDQIEIVHFVQGG